MNWVQLDRNSALIDQYIVVSKHSFVPSNSPLHQILDEIEIGRQRLNYANQFPILIYFSLEIFKMVVAAIKKSQRFPMSLGSM